MAGNSNSNSSGSTSSNNSGSSSSTADPAQGKSNKMLIYIIAAVVVVIAIVIIVIAASFKSGPLIAPALQLGSTNGTPIYMSYDQGAALLGPVSNYSASDLFNSTSYLNITTIESITPWATDNVTEGWGTLVQGQNATDNATIEFYVMKTYNASEIAGNIASSFSQAFEASPQTEYGTENGLSYTYEVYRNGTSNFQIVTGWKGNYTTLALLISNPGFSVNQSSFIGIAANDTP